jgi:nicotinamidase-related amidase
MWNDDQGQPLQPFDCLTGDLTIMRMGQAVGKATPSPLAASVVAGGNLGWLRQQAAYYSRELEKGGKYPLLMWPEHCILGSDGHALVGIVHEARMFHSYVRGTQSHAEVKGGSPLTECYSVLGAEVLTRFDGEPLAQKNVRFIRTLLDADYVIIAGQAASHCVKSSISDLLSEILAKDPALARKVYVVEDCMSAVTVPNPAGGFFVDNTPDAEKALADFANAGMHVVKSTTPISDWPELSL